MTPSDTTLFAHSLRGFRRTLPRLDHYLTHRDGWTVIQPRDADPGQGPLTIVLQRATDGAEFKAVFTSGDGGATWEIAGDLQPVPDGYVAPE